MIHSVSPSNFGEYSIRNMQTSKEHFTTIVYAKFWGQIAKMKRGIGKQSIDIHNSYPIFFLSSFLIVFVFLQRCISSFFPIKVLYFYLVSARPSHLARLSFNTDTSVSALSLLVFLKISKLKLIIFCINVNLKELKYRLVVKSSH